MADEGHDIIAPAAWPAEAASVSLMITRRQRAALRALGATDEAIALMTPAEAHARLRGQPSSPSDL